MRVSGARKGEAGVRTYMRQLFATRGHLAFLGLVFPQTWMYILSSGVVCSEQPFQLAFHAGMLGCLFVLALVGLCRRGAWPAACDVAFAAPMVALPLAGLLPWMVQGPYALVLGALAGVGMGWCFAAWFYALCQVPLRNGFCYVLLGFSLGALGCLLFKMLIDLWLPLALMAGAALPVVSVAAVRLCLRLGTAGSGQECPAAPTAAASVGKIVVLVVQIVVYALVFGNGFVFSVLQDSIHASDHSAGIALLNYGLRALLPLVLMVWLAVQSGSHAATYEPVFKVLMLVGVFVLLGVWFIGGLDTLVSYALVSTARNMVLMLLFLTCLKLAAVTGRSPWFVYGVGRGAYELSVIAGIVGYAWLVRTFGFITLGADLVYLTALCVLAFLTSCFFATARSLGESEEPAQVPAVEVSREASDHTGLRLRYALNDREFQILMLFYRGNSKRRIAEQIGISENTVRWYLQQLYARMGIHSRDELLELVDGLE